MKPKAYILTLGSNLHLREPTPSDPSVGHIKVYPDLETCKAASQKPLTEIYIDKKTGKQCWHKDTPT